MEKDYSISPVYVSRNWKLQALIGEAHGDRKRHNGSGGA